MTFEAIAQKIVSDSGKKLATTAELEPLRKLQSEFQTAQTSMAAHDIVSAYSAWLEHIARLTSVARKGAAHTEAARSRESFEADFLAKNDAAKVRCARYAKRRSRLPVLSSRNSLSSLMLPPSRLNSRKPNCSRNGNWPTRRVSL